jgi:hypothetical protein|tara:strand:+ start:2366 stop:2545 length:180 start_codon:yes stop_codon:yes gene_type:complete
MKQNEYEQYIYQSTLIENINTGKIIVPNVPTMKNKEAYEVVKTQNVEYNSLMNPKKLRP